jgi:MFS family permease
MPIPLAPALNGAAVPTIYNRVFWLSYAANALAVAANALTFRFAEFVAFLGGTEQDSGNIVSTGVVVAVVLRFWLGQAIDRHGTRHIWLGSSVLFVCSCLLFLMRHELGIDFYAARILFSVGLAGMFSCSIVHIQKQVPPHRRTEIIASLGSSGFLGMIAGPLIGDVIFRTVPAGHLRFIALFAGSALFGCIYFGLVIQLTRGDRHRRPHETPAAHRLIFRYWPGPIVLVAMMMGMNFTVMSVFLTRFATFLGLPGISTFFIGYAAAAFTFRLATRNWAETVGRHQMALIGLLGIGCGQAMFLGVSANWHLLFPALCCGFGHALLFPAVVSLGAGRFPPHYRGTGTTLVLGFTELGTVISAPVLGAIIDYYNHRGFAQMFAMSSALPLIVALYYVCTAARQPDQDLLDDDILPLTRGIPVPAVVVATSEPAADALPAAVASGTCQPVGRSA